MSKSRLSTRLTSFAIAAPYVVAPMVADAAGKCAAMPESQCSPVPAFVLLSTATDASQAGVVHATNQMNGEPIRYQVDAREVFGGWPADHVMRWHPDKRG